MKIFDPTAGPVTGRSIMAERLDTLEGKKISVLWNGQPHGDKIIRRLLDLLKEEYSFEVVDFFKKPYIGNIAPEEYFDKLFNGEADAVLVGIGD